MKLPRREPRRILKVEISLKRKGKSPEAFILKASIPESEALPKYRKMHADLMLLLKCNGYGGRVGE
jgi:hypothetical protein